MTPHIERGWAVLVTPKVGKAWIQRPFFETRSLARKAQKRWQNEDAVIPIKHLNYRAIKIEVREVRK